MKDSTLIFLVLVAGLVVAYLFSRRGSEKKTQTVAAAQTPNSVLTLGSILDGWLGRAGKVISPAAAAATPTLNSTPAATGAVYQQSNLSGIASLVSAGSGALGQLFNIGSNLFGAKSGDTLPAIPGGQPQTITYAGSIPKSAVSGGVDMPASLDWGAFA